MRTVNVLNEPVFVRADCWTATAFPSWWNRNLRRTIRRAAQPPLRRRAGRSTPL